MVYTTPPDVAAHTQAPAAGFVVVEFVFDTLRRMFLASLRIGRLVLVTGQNLLGEPGSVWEAAVMLPVSDKPASLSPSELS